MDAQSEHALATNLYYDRQHARHAAKVLPGEYYVTARPMVLVTVLGSCVAACIRDPVLNVGGLNHFMLPDAAGPGPASSAARYGSYAMELLINQLIKLGARRERLEAKVFGGGNVLANLLSSDVGGRNAQFVLDYLATEGIRLAARDLLGPYPRKVYFFPDSGRVLVRKLKSLHNGTILARERDYGERLREAPVGGDVELFA
jgi:chemotaxis protein CheD